MEYEHKKRFLINSAFVSVWLIIGYIITKFMVSFLLPFVIALLISFFSNKAASAIGQKTGLKSAWLKFALLLLFYLVAILTAGVVIFLIIKHSGSFFSTVKDYITSPDNLFTKIIGYPGLCLQKITTNEPDDSQLEVAIESMKAVLTENKEDDKW